MTQRVFSQGVTLVRRLAQVQVRVQVQMEVQVLRRRLSNSMLGCDPPENPMIRDRDPALMARMPSHMSRDRSVLHNPSYRYYPAVHAE